MHEAFAAQKFAVEPSELERLTETEPMGQLSLRERKVHHLMIVDST